MFTDMDNAFELAAASPVDGLDVLEMLHEIGPGENGFGNGAHNLDRSAWPNYLALLANQAAGVGLAPRHVPQTTYWLRRGGYPVATSKLRHTLNDALLVYGGHVGYCVRPSERGKGYGHVLLAATLEQARRLGITRVLITVNLDNQPSRRMIEHQGGVLESGGAEGQCRYWVALNLTQTPR